MAALKTPIGGSCFRCILSPEGLKMMAVKGVDSPRILKAGWWGSDCAVIIHCSFHPAQHTFPVPSTPNNML